MRYLKNNDYDTIIQSKNLLEIINKDYNVLYNTELIAIQECTAFLNEKFQMNLEFTDTEIYRPTTIYRANRRIYLYSDNIYVNTNVYNADDLVQYTTTVNGLPKTKIYKCLVSTSLVPTNILYWEELGDINTMYFSKLPYLEYSVSKPYTINEYVWFENHTYYALLPNTFSPPIVGGNQYWFDAGEYVIPANTINNSVNFEQKDDRNGLIVNALCVSVLYHLKRLSPVKSPLWIEDEYKRILELYQSVKVGNLVLQLKYYNPTQGRRLLIGSNYKESQNYL